MVTPDTLIDLDGLVEPLLAHWSRTRTGRREGAQAAAVCLQLWDTHAAGGWDGRTHIRAGSLRTFEFALAAEVTRRYCEPGGNGSLAWVLDTELDAVINQTVHASELHSDPQSLTSTVQTCGADPYAPASADPDELQGCTATMDVEAFAHAYEDEVRMSNVCPVVVGKDELLRRMAAWIYASRVAPIDTVEWIEAAARAHAIRTLVVMMEAP
ncbi:hypothetical protein ACT17_22765 [Mycolicibacterium conceptionense]|uniref:Uncharacterized protein n=1 Tax=Mycolicibacterium conceptionense TaxID=451644 RepID=A0A0J8U4A5_9MYCO|nr:hypothetical protein [Mycolicibacterium conceptionense]KMV15922.1 hypothetical protein ACT17_22765 [Mycolicibacterium conceptionense]